MSRVPIMTKGRRLGLRHTKTAGQRQRSPAATNAAIHSDVPPTIRIDCVHGQQAMRLSSGQDHAAGLQDMTVYVISASGTTHHRNAGVTVSATVTGSRTGG